MSSANKGDRMTDQQRHEAVMYLYKLINDDVAKKEVKDKEDFKVRLDAVEIIIKGDVFFRMENS